MRQEYDLSKLSFKKNPYARRLKKQITIRLDSEIVEYFKEIGEDNEISYQSLINLYLRECVKKQKKPLTKWIKAS